MSSDEQAQLINIFESPNPILRQDDAEGNSVVRAEESRAHIKVTYMCFMGQLSDVC